MGDASGLRTGKAAQILGVRPETLRKWADAGEVPSWRDPAGQRRFERADLEAVRQKHREPA